jgi:TPR repeat protein
MTNTGTMYKTGQGVAKDDVQAASWYRKAADAGNGPAMRFLGDMYAEGRGGLAKDEDQAASWYFKALATGDALALESLHQIGR